MCRSDVSTSTVLHSIAFEGLTQVDSTKEQFNRIRHVLGVSKIPSKGTKTLLPKYLADRETPSGPVNTLPVVSQVHQAGSTQGHCTNGFTPANRNYACSYDQPSIYPLYSAAQQTEVVFEDVWWQQVMLRLFFTSTLDGPPGSGHFTPGIH
jgi:hypothetical protein